MELQPVPHALQAQPSPFVGGFRIKSDTAVADIQLQGAAGVPEFDDG